MQCRSYIAGNWSANDDGPEVELYNPADQSEVVSTTRHASATLATDAVQAAVGAWTEWRLTPTAERRKYLISILSGIEHRRDAFANAIHRETGKTLSEAEQEVDATAAEARAQLEVFAAGVVQRIGGHEVSYEPLGAVLLVTPSNFPLAATMRKLLPALLAGNTAVVKASELTPVTSTCLFELFAEVGVPAGVANLVLGDGRDVVPAMIGVSGLRAVSLTGSNTADSAIAAAIGERGIRYQAELGGSNVAVVLADAEIEVAIDAIVTHGFACAGQWCTGTTRVVVEAAVFEEFRIALVDRVRRLAAGRDAAIGAMISRAHLDRVAGAVDQLIRNGAVVLCGGRREEDDRGGLFFQPTLLEAGRQAEIGEIFGPVLVLQPANDPEDAVGIANASCFGLSFSVFTRNDDLAAAAVAAANAGLCHVNLGTGYRDSALPLLGWNDSGRGGPECGTWARDFFTRTKAIYKAG